LDFAHREVFRVVGEQSALALDRNGGHDRVGEGQRAALSGPRIFQPAGKTSGGRGKLNTLEALQESFRPGLFSGAHSGVELSDVERAGNECVTETNEPSEKFAALV
jgi:hypothetical protein